LDSIFETKSEFYNSAEAVLAFIIQDILIESDIAQLPRDPVLWLFGLVNSKASNKRSERALTRLRNFYILTAREAADLLTVAIAHDSPHERLQPKLLALQPLRRMASRTNSNSTRPYGRHSGSEAPKAVHQEDADAGENHEQEHEEAKW